MSHEPSSPGETENSPSAAGTSVPNEYDRRGFLQRAGGVVLAASAGGLAFAQAKGNAASVASGGDIKVGLVGYPVTFDVAFGVQNGILMNKNTMDCLVTITETMKGAPQLATSWSSPDGGKTWVFNLRKNVTWQDGVPFTSNDVKVHFLRLINPKTGSGGATAFSGISTISTPNAHTVVFHLKGPNEEFPVETGQYQGNIQAAHVNPKTYAKSSIGTGPFKMGQIVPGQSIQLVKNPTYFVPGEPKLDSVTFVFFSDQQSRLNALLGNEVDVALDVPKELLAQVQAQSGLRLSKSLPGSFDVVYLRADQSPGNNPKVMQALKLSIDRQAIVQAVLKGYGQATGDNPVGPSLPAWVNVGVPKQNIPAAKALLASAGYPNGLQLPDFYVPGGIPGLDVLSLAVQSMAGQAGMKFKITTIPNETFYATYWLKESMGDTDWSLRPTVDSQLRIAYYSTGAWNESHWSDPTFDALLDKALAQPNPAVRRKIQAQVQREIAKNGNVLVPYHFPVISGVASRVLNLNTHPMLVYTDFRKVGVSA